MPAAVAVLCGLLAAIGGWTASPALARAAAARTVVYHGYRLTVPAGWPVVGLAGHPATCVRFDRHAVYLGRPGAIQLCPAGAAGRTEAVLVTPSSGAGAAALLAPAGASDRHAVVTAGQLVDRVHHVVVTATWNRDPGVIRRALGVRALTALTRRSSRPAPRVAAAVVAAYARRSRTVRGRAASASVPGGAFSGSGFDACSTPSTSQMNAWTSSPYQAVGVYIGGENMACPQPNLTASWVSQQSAAAWHLIPIFVGLQAPSNSCGCAGISPGSPGSQGTSDAQQAVADAQAIGLGPGNPLYLDMEAYSRTTTNTGAVLAFVSAWTTQLHSSGYLSGVYSSDGSGIRDLVAQYGTGYAEPDDIWAANWNGSRSTVDSAIPAQDWANHQRLHQYQGAHDESYGGVTINIDGDYLDAATGAAGSGFATAVTPASAPTLKVTTAPSGSIVLSPAWSGASGVTGWQILGGQDPNALTFTGPPTARVPIVTPNAFAYFAVRALGSAGQVLGTSPVVATPNHIAIDGQSVFTPRRGLMGIPVGCFAASGCTLTTTVSLGRTTLARTGPERLGPGGGLVYASLTPAARVLLARVRGHRVTTQVTVRDASGMRVSRALRLTSFLTSGAAPGHSLAASGAITLIGAADFVSNGWVGGILARCTAAVPCSAATTLVAGRRTIARSRPQSLGVGQIGYLMFTLTPAGHRLLVSARGNQLPVSVTVSGGGGSAAAGGRIILIAY